MLFSHTDILWDLLPAREVFFRRGKTVLESSMDNFSELSRERVVYVGEVQI